MIVALIPAFEEEKTIARVVLVASWYVDKVIVCDDGSTDLTGEIARKLGAEVIRHKQQSGVGAAYNSLFKRAKELNPDVVVTLDADGQHNPHEIPNLLSPILKGEADVVIGSRFLPGSSTDMPWFKRLGNRLLSRFASKTYGGEVSDTESGFRAYNRKAYRSLKSIGESGYPACSEILRSLMEKGMKVVEVPISCRYEGIRPPRTHPVRHASGVLSSIILYVVEKHPLTLLGLPGFLMILIGSFFTSQVLYFYTVEGRVITNLALASVFFILLGLFTVFSSLMFYMVSRLKKTLEGRL